MLFQNFGWESTWNQPGKAEGWAGTHARDCPTCWSCGSWLQSPNPQAPDVGTPSSVLTFFYFVYTTVKNEYMGVSTTRGTPQMDGLSGKIPSRSGWFSSTPPIYGNPHMVMCTCKCCRGRPELAHSEASGHFAIDDVCQVRVKGRCASSSRGLREVCWDTQKRCIFRENM